MRQFIFFTVSFFLFQTTVLAKDRCDIGEYPRVLRNYSPNPSDATNYVDEVEYNYTCFTQQKNTCQVGVLEHSADGYAGDHTAFYILLNGKLVYLNTTKYYDGTYGSEWGSDRVPLEFIGTFIRIKNATGC